MSEIRRSIARLVERHIDEILDRTMDAFAREIPAVADASVRVQARVRESTRRATVAFIALYADPDSPARVMLDQARRATLDRAGELFDREDILAMLRTGRHVVYDAAREFVRAEMDVDPAHEKEIDAALDAFMDELERADQLLPQTDDAVHDLLSSAEIETPDLA